MGPRPAVHEVALGPATDEDARELRAALEDDDKGVVLTPEQLKHWAETGDWPDSSG